jgi:hypothetical protein
MKVSIVVNCDTRPENYSEGGLTKGVVSRDFLTDGIFNKLKFFAGFEVELIVCIDEHEPISEEDLNYVRTIATAVLIRKHTDEPKFNDWNYWRALAMADGDIICHMDQDTAVFASSPQSVLDLINLLDTYDYVSYPSHWSPNPVVDSNYDYWWCSTRFFMCKRETLDFGEIKKCLSDSEYLYGKYPASVRNPWMEHVLALISKYTGKGVYYPPIELDKTIIFSWGNYDRWILRRLNGCSYEEMKQWISAHPIIYPNNVNV